MITRRKFTPCLLITVIVVFMTTFVGRAPGQGGQPGEGTVPTVAAVRVRDRHGFEAWYEPSGDGSGVYVYSRTRNASGLEGVFEFLSQLSGLFLFGLVGQLMFSARFILQWIASERAGKSVVPVAFWWLSIGGTLTLLAYFAIRHEPIGMLGQACGLPIYARNLFLVTRHGSRVIAES